MYPGVPRRVRSCVDPSAARLLMPKSPIFTHHIGFRETTKTFSSQYQYIPCLPKRGLMLKTYLRIQIPVSITHFMHPA